ncbi:serine-pyruvate aminotransferase [Xanthomonas arboricola pv. pruni str. MAFF 311562]|uniref:Serine-pyruvate aminotransferase n=1 Tax=Xanthomonas arboricola pv. pruni str. MAFF 311562 TaxID=1414836 RepID=W4SAC0_9XANT|nr:serine-pyruvate aminotransferase [Xanthomonas arboricola pv. pruni str. MAFF 311562]
MSPDLRHLHTFGELDPPQRLLMGPGPVNAHPRVLRAMAADLLGQFDPEMTTYMNEVMALYRPLFGTENRWTFLVDGTARAGIEAALVSLVSPGDRVLVINFGRFGLLLTEILGRLGADLHTVDAPWGEVVPLAAIAEAIERVAPKLVATVHGDTSTTMAQPLDGLGALCRAAGALSYVDATATIGGMPIASDRWDVDVVTGGLQKCLGGPSGSAPITVSDAAAEAIFARRHVERGIVREDIVNGSGPRIASNYFDLAMIMDYWSDKRLNHHTEATTMLYGARECARVALQEGLDARFARHAAAGRAVSAGIRALGLEVFGDDAHRMTNVTGVVIPHGIDSDAVRRRMREDFEIEIGTAFGPLQGRIWRIGAMGYNAMKHKVLITLAALEAVLRAEGYACTPGWRWKPHWRPGTRSRMHEHSARPGRLWRHPACGAVARWRAHRGAVRHQLRRGRGKLRAQRRCRLGGLPVGDDRHASAARRARHGDGKPVRIRQPCRLLAAASVVHCAQCAGDRIRRGAGTGLQSRSGRRDAGRRLGDRQPRPALDRLPACG